MRSVIPDVLADAAERWPDVRAVTAGERSLTYAELDRAADGVAGALAEMGVALGGRVGVYSEKSVEALASIYGIMRAGGAYVPIDVEAPLQRCAYIARNCALSALISPAGKVRDLSEFDAEAAPRGITLDEGAPRGFIDWAEVQSAAMDPPARRIVETDLAYILYTSGSSGQPKGVMISHRNGLSFVDWARRTLGFRHGDIFSSHAPFHFDLSVLDLYGAAAVGGSVSCVPASAALFPIRLAEWIRRQRISVWYSVPSALCLLTRYGDLHDGHLDSLRLILFAGEVFPTRFLSDLMSLVPRARYFNLYGPTETNVCTYHEVSRPPAPDDPPVPIGVPCDNDRGVVIDGRGEEIASRGGEGELIVQGPTVARGYWGDPEKTARGFVAPGTYRTGDIVRILEGPEDRPLLSFLGRDDHMVKSRGYRIELGEVEAVLYADARVEEACVVAVPDELLGSLLVAFCRGQASLDTVTLQRLCRSRLPDYMVPVRLSILPELPKTSSGKVDRRTLTDMAEHEIRPTSRV